MQNHASLSAAGSERGLVNAGPQASGGQGPGLRNNINGKTVLQPSESPWVHRAHTQNHTLSRHESHLFKLRNPFNCPVSHHNHLKICNTHE